MTPCFHAAIVPFFTLSRNLIQVTKCGVETQVIRENTSTQCYYYVCKVPNFSFSYCTTAVGAFTGGRDQEMNWLQPYHFKSLYSTCSPFSIKKKIRDRLRTKLDLVWSGGISRIFQSSHRRLLRKGDLWQWI